MSSPTLDFTTIATVPQNYSWDEGTPLIGYELSRLLINDESLFVPSNNSSGVEYIGYAPYSVLTFSSTLNPNPSAIITKRVIDFGDYYNNQNNIIVSEALSAELYCHTYVMPGLYTVKMTTTEYVKAEDQQLSFFSCIERYCKEWTWKSTQCLPTTNTRTTWLSTASTKSLEKRWRDRPEERCDAPWVNTGGIYVQPTELAAPLPIFWQWCNYSCFPTDNLRNLQTTWDSSSFQKSNQIVWSEATVCTTIPYRATSWTWNQQTCGNVLLSSSTQSSSFSWDELKRESCDNRTWDEITIEDCYEAPYNIATSVNQIVKEAIIRVIEIPPKAYIESNQSEVFDERMSPYTVTLTPRFIKCGSFPIERIDWDLGDGTPIISQKRWAVNKDPRFVYSGAYSLDWQDPRNYDIVHTYTKTIDSNFSFYPSLTCYASSTHTNDCASTVIGPLKLRSVTTADTTANVKLIQNELTDKGVVLIGEIDKTIAAWNLSERKLTDNIINIFAQFEPGSLKATYTFTPQLPLDLDTKISFTARLSTADGEIVHLPAGFKLKANTIEPQQITLTYNQYNFLDFINQADLINVNTFNNSTIYKFTTNFNFSFSYEFDHNISSLPLSIVEDSFRQLNVYAANGVGDRVYYNKQPQNGLNETWSALTVYVDDIPRTQIGFTLDRVGQIFGYSTSGTTFQYIGRFTNTPPWEVRF